MTMSLTGKAQAPYYEPSAKVYTPLTEQPGAPAESYPLSGFDNVNLFNGHLSFSFAIDANRRQGQGRIYDHVADRATLAGANRCGPNV